jgi:hypothetical protein
MYQILSPDSFPISAEPFKSKKSAIQFYENWKNDFKKVQGFYSTIQNGERVHLAIEDLDDYCTLEKI